MTVRILIVDDDANLRGVAKRYLEGRSYSVLEADNGSTALLLAKEARPDLVISDAEMPGLDGHTLCRVLRQDAATRSIPLIIMTGSKVDEESVLAGFDGGADDYILKPFSFPILAAHIQAVLRRFDSVSENAAVLERCGLELDPARRTARRDGKLIALTRKEFDLLALLIGKPGRVFSARQLLEKVWGYDLADYNDVGTVEVHVSRLRKKLGAGLARHLVNLSGVGYKFEE